MDPVAHTLVGAALAETGLRRVSRHATATLLIGANLPDVDALANLWGGDTALWFRRGLSHGVLALVVLPVLLAVAVWLWQRGPGRARPGAAEPPFRPGGILALSFLAVWSHPLLDWLNTYGVRLLMPFDGRWFYGDTLFIVDPWLWLLAAAGIVLARPASRRAVAGWIALAAAATAIVLTSGQASSGVALGWCGALLLLAALRWRTRPRGARPPLARAGFAALVLYVCVVYGAARLAEAEAARRFGAPLQAQSNPVPGRPFEQRMVLVYANAYRVVATDGRVHELPRTAPDAVVRAALASESIRGFANWMRHPYWQVERTPRGWIVRIWDLRYQGPGSAHPSGIGFAQVEVPKEAVAEEGGAQRR